MSFALISGLGALIFGIGYNKAYKNYSRNKINLNIIGAEPRDTRPRPEFYYTVKDLAAMEQAEHEWNKYNEIRKYYYQLMVERANEISRKTNINYFRDSEFWIPEREFSRMKLRGVKEDSDSYKELIHQCSDITIKSNAYSFSGFLGYGSNNEQHHIYLDNRFSDIYKEMLSQGVNLEFRPGIDRLNLSCWSKGIEDGERKGWFPQDLELISQGRDTDTLCGFKYIFTQYGLDNVHMDYKRFYKPQYVV